MPLSSDLLCLQHWCSRGAAYLFELRSVRPPYTSGEESGSGGLSEGGCGPGFLDSLSTPAPSPASILNQFRDNCQEKPEVDSFQKLTSNFNSTLSSWGSYRARNSARGRRAREQRQDRISRSRGGRDQNGKTQASQNGSPDGALGGVCENAGAWREERGGGAGVQGGYMEGVTVCGALWPG